MKRVLDRDEILLVARSTYTCAVELFTNRLGRQLTDNEKQEVAEHVHDNVSDDLRRFGLPAAQISEWRPT